MGMFSWRTADTEESIPALASMRHVIQVKMLDNKNNVFVENEYEGYGIFGGKDFYVLVAEMNGFNLENTEEMRKKGIDLASSKKEDVILPKIVTVECNEKWQSLPNNKNCPFRGYFFPEGEEGFVY